MRLLALAVWLSFVGCSFARSENDTRLYLASQEFLTSSEAKIKWGNHPFSPEKFKKGSVEEKAAMAAQLTRIKTLLGKTPTEIKTLLGEFSGHFWNDSIPTYLIEEGWQKGGDSWQVVFLLDNVGRVSEIKIHKNCCNKTKTPQDSP